MAGIRELRERHIVDVTPRIDAGYNFQGAKYQPGL